MENLENDVKKAQLLSDEELKEVAGGSQGLPWRAGDQCAQYVMPRDCMKVQGKEKPQLRKRKTMLLIFIASLIMMI